jgi:hypothetical protein
MRKYSMATYYFGKAVEANAAYVQSEKAKGAFDWKRRWWSASFLSCRVWYSVQFGRSMF